MRDRIQKLFVAARERAFAPVDIASIVFFRIAFGLLMTLHCWTFFTNDRIADWWLRPNFLFKFYGFGWVHPWPGNGLYLHATAMSAFALLLAIGCLYRLSATLFFFSYAYFFLLDELRYQNHQYLICLFGLLLIFIPAHRALSIDAVIRPKVRQTTVPALALWILRMQLAVVYFFGGVAKLDPDWRQGAPMRWVMARHQDFPLIGRFFTREWMVYLMSYGALLFDLCIVPLLLWRRTRSAAFCLAVLFHFTNNGLFSIDVFPWMAIASTTLFFSPDWPRRLIARLRGRSTDQTADAAVSPISQRRKNIILAAAGVYLLVQLLLPLRPFVFPGGSEWAFMQHRFCWRMMLRRQFVHGYFYVTDPNIGRTRRLAPQDFLTRAQMIRIYWQPDMVLQCAHYLASIRPPSGPKPLEVEARLFISINGRRPELFVDPTTNLAAESRTLTRPRWLRPIVEPLPPPGEDQSRDPFGSLF